MIKTIIVDDDSFHHESLKQMLTEHFKQIVIVATSTNVPDAVEKINELKPQLVFLDIEMSPYSGFDLLAMVEERDFEVIFTTSYQKYAIQAIKASALDYLEKPVDLGKLAESIQRYQNKTGQDRIANLLQNFKLPYENQRIALPDCEGIHFFEVNRIIYCINDNSSTHFYIKTDDPKIPVKRLTVSKGLGHWEDFLFEKGPFFRVHNRYMVNINYIKRFSKGDNAYLEIENIQGTISIARDKKNEFIKFLKSKKIVL